MKYISENDSSNFSEKIDINSRKVITNHHKLKLSNNTVSTCFDSKGIVGTRNCGEIINLKDFSIENFNILEFKKKYNENMVYYVFDNILNYQNLKSLINSHKIESFCKEVYNGYVSSNAKYHNVFTS